jgi:hypothetical protein
MRLSVYSGNLIIAAMYLLRVVFDGRSNAEACSADVQRIGFMYTVAS